MTLLLLGYGVWNAFPTPHAGWGGASSPPCPWPSCCPLLLQKRGEGKCQGKGEGGKLVPDCKSCLGRAASSRWGRKIGCTAGPIRGGTTTSNLTTPGKGQRAGTKGGGAGGSVPGRCAGAGGLGWGGARCRARVDAVQTATYQRALGFILISTHINTAAKPEETFWRN
jgi:hypothetical protein